MARNRSTTMTAAEFRALRTATGLDVADWAVRLDCGAQSVRNIERGNAQIGRQMAVLATLMAHPQAQSWLIEAYRHKAQLLREKDNFQQNTP